MTGKTIDLVKRASETSALGTVIRPAMAGSTVCAAVVSIAGRLRRTRQRTVVGLGGRWSTAEAVANTRQLERLAYGSRVIGTLSWLLERPSIAWRESTVKRRLADILAKDLLERIRMFALIVVIAVMTHTILLAALRVPVHEIGWGIRAGLVAVAAGVFARPAPFAAAWCDRTARRARNGA